jgi:predicted  nucleic acid-binding Zn-ribbon protein
MTEDVSLLMLEQLKHIRRTVERTEEDVQDLKLRVADLERHHAYSAVTDARLQSSLDKMTERLDRIERQLDLIN